MPYRTTYEKRKLFHLGIVISKKFDFLKVNTYLYTAAYNIRPHPTGFIESGRTRFRPWDIIRCIILSVFIYIVNVYYLPGNF